MKEGKYNKHFNDRKEKWSDPETGHSPNFWSRAIGWYVMAIVDILEYLPENNPDRPKMIMILQNVCDALMKVQDKKSGVWYQALDQGDKEGNYLEASGSAMYVYAFANGDILTLNKKYTRADFNSGKER